MYEEQAVMLAWIGRIEQKTSAQLLDSMIGDSLKLTYGMLLPLIQKVKATDDEVRRERGQEPSPPLPVVAIVPVVRDADGETTPVRVAPPDGGDKPPPKRKKKAAG